MGSNVLYSHDSVFKYDININQQFYSDISHRGWTIDGQYFYKKCSREECLNELLGMHLAKLIELKTAEYTPAVAIKKNKVVSSGVVSKDITGGVTKFYTIKEICDEYKLHLKNINLEKFKNLFLTDNSWDYFMRDFLKLIAVDYYMSQVDRSKTNLPLFKTNEGFALAPIYDYSAAMGTRINYIYNYKNNIIENINTSYVYGNALTIISFPSDEFYKLIEKYPEFKSDLKKIYEANILEMVQDIINESGLCNINLDFIKKYDEAKKKKLSLILTK
jgi:hypothetical protein